MAGLSIIIPIYNEEKSVKGTIRAIRENMARHRLDYEVIAVNDGSEDHTLDRLKEIEGIKVLSHRHNKGYGASLKTGLRLAAYDNICITDADGTYPNAKIPDLFDTYLEQHLDMVVGARTGLDVSYPFLRRIPKFFLRALANYISNTKIPDINSGLRIFKKDIAMKYFQLYPAGFSFTTTLTLSMLCGGYEVDFVPVDYFKRSGKSKVKPVRDTVGFFSLLIKVALYFNPFKFFTPIILVFSVLSAAALIRDIFFLKDLTQSSIFFPVFTFLFFTIGLLADLIIKRTQ